MKMLFIVNTYIYVLLSIHLCLLITFLKKYLFIYLVALGLIAARTVSCGARS